MMHVNRIWTILRKIKLTAATSDALPRERCSPIYLHLPKQHPYASCQVSYARPLNQTQFPLAVIDCFPKSTGYCIIHNNWCMRSLQGYISLRVEKNQPWLSVYKSTMPTWIIKLGNFLVLLGRTSVVSATLYPKCYGLESPYLGKIVWIWGGDIGFWQ